MNTTLEQTKEAAVEPAARLAEAAYASPRIRVLQSTDNYVVEAEMPGVNRDGLEITLEGDELTLVGRRPETNGGVAPLYQEASPQNYRRVLVLDPALDTTKIRATVENGLVTLVLPKAEQARPRRIEVS